MAGPDFQADISNLILELSDEFGTGKMPCVVRAANNDGDRPWSITSTPTDAETFGIETTKELRNGVGDVLRIARVILLDPIGVAPAKGDTMAINVEVGSVTAATKFERIESVNVTNPAGTVLLYEVMLAD